MSYLQHHGIKGMKWGRRRFQNSDGSLTPEGVRRYRKEYDDVKSAQKRSEYWKNGTNKTGISVADKYNQKYADKEARNKLTLLLKQLDDRKISQIEDEIINEGKAVAEKLKKEAEAINAMLDEIIDIDDNYLFLTDPQQRYDSAYDRYLHDHLIKR